MSTRPSYDEAVRIVEDRLAAITYKPGWRLEVHADFTHGGVTFAVLAEVEDSYGHRPGFNTVAHQRRVDPVWLAIMGPGEFVRWVRHVLIDVEVHELGEWLVVDGVRPFDPHRPISERPAADLGHAHAPPRLPL